MVALVSVKIKINNKSDEIDYCINEINTVKVKLKLMIEYMFGSKRSCNDKMNYCKTTK